MNNDWCCICGEDACDELREGSPVCDFHRSMVDGGYTLDELREERDAEDDDTQKLPDISHLVNALTEGDQRYEALVDDSGWDGEALAGEIVRDRMALARAIGLTADDVLNEDIEVITERIAEIITERDALAAQLRKQGRVIDTLKRARDRYLQRLTDVRAERDALKTEDTDGA